MSPEQARGEPVDGRSDLYAVGVILFAMLAGRLPFTAETPLGVALKQVTEQVPRPSSIRPDVNPLLEEVCLRALEKSPDARFASAREMRQALRTAVRTSDAASTLATRTTVPNPPTALLSAGARGLRPSVIETPTLAEVPSEAAPMVLGARAALVEDEVLEAEICSRPALVDAGPKRIEVVPPTRSSLAPAALAPSFLPPPVPKLALAGMPPAALSSFAPRAPTAEHLDLSSLSSRGPGLGLLALTGTGLRSVRLGRRTSRAALATVAAVLVAATAALVRAEKRSSALTGSAFSAPAVAAVSPTAPSARPVEGPTVGAPPVDECEPATVATDAIDSPESPGAIPSVDPRAPTRHGGGSAALVGSGSNPGDVVARSQCDRRTRVSAEVRAAVQTEPEVLGPTSAELLAPSPPTDSRASARPAVVNPSTNRDLLASRRSLASATEAPSALPSVSVGAITASTSGLSSSAVRSSLRLSALLRCYRDGTVREGRERPAQGVLFLYAERSGRITSAAWRGTNVAGLGSCLESSARQGHVGPLDAPASAQVALSFAPR